MCRLLLSTISVLTGVVVVAYSTCAVHSLIYFIFSFCFRSSVFSKASPFILKFKLTWRCLFKSRNFYGSYNSLSWKLTQLVSGCTAAILLQSLWLDNKEPRWSGQRGRLWPLHGCRLQVQLPGSERNSGVDRLHQHHPRRSTRTQDGAIWQWSYFCGHRCISFVSRSSLTQWHVNIHSSSAYSLLVFRF